MNLLLNLMVYLTDIPDSVSHLPTICTIFDSISPPYLSTLDY